MNLPVKSLGAAVSLALISVSAHAQLTAPGQVLNAAPTDPTNLYVAIYDSASNNNELVNLGYTYAQLTAASGNLTPNSANSAFVQAAAPTGSGNVLQLNFGTISGFGTLFTSANAATTGFTVLAAVSGGAGTEGFEATASSQPVTAYGGVNLAVLNIQGEIAAWNSNAPATAGDLKDTTGTEPYSVQTGVLNSGEIIPGQPYNGALNTAVGFYNITTTTAHKAVITQYANATGDGYWYLSSSGDLTYNVPEGSVAPVPIPAAAWLLGSGLLGMAGIARRRRAA
jgi:hypothetical protein